MDNDYPSFAGYLIYLLVRMGERIFPVFETSHADLRPLLSLREFVGDIAVRFHPQGIAVAGKTMEGQVVYELFIRGETTGLQADTEEEVVVGVEPSLLETDIKHISKNKRIFLTAYETLSDVTSEKVLCLRVFTEDKLHTTSFGPIDSPAIRLAPEAFARANKFMCPRKLAEAINSSKSTRTDAIYMSIEPNTSHLVIEARGCGRTTRNLVEIFDDEGLSVPHVFDPDERSSSYYAFMVLRGICTIAPAASVQQLRFGTDGALLFFSITYLSEGTRFDALIAPIPEEYVRPASKRKASSAPVQPPAPKRAFYKSDEDE
jgi:hypothetical protein